MTKAELLKMLAPIDPDVEIEAYNPDVQCFMPVSGMVFVPIIGTSGFVELKTDDL